MKYFIMMFDSLQPFLRKRGIFLLKEIEKINNTELSVKVYQGQRVVTFKDIDTVHERPEGTAGRNFRENKDKFIENEDFFYLSGEELKKYKQATDFVGSNAREFILITEQGYLMLAKSLTDDLAWKVQRQLVKSYFRKPQQSYWQETRQTAKEIRLLETDSIKEFVAYAKGQGSQHAERYYYSFTALANKAAGITSGRDGANVQQLATLSLIEHIITEVIQCDMRQEKPYKAIYLDCKAR